MSVLGMVEVPPEVDRLRDAWLVARNAEWDAWSAFTTALDEWLTDAVNDADERVRGS